MAESDSSQIEDNFITGLTNLQNLTAHHNNVGILFNTVTNATCQNNQVAADMPTYPGWIAGIKEVGTCTVTYYNNQFYNITTIGP